MKEEISLGELVVICLRFTKKYLLWFVIAAAIGIAFGYYQQSKVLPKHYSEAIICSDILDGQRLSEIITDFEEASKSNNLGFFAEKLGISKDSAANIGSIKIEFIKPEIIYRTDVDLTKVNTHHCIRVICSTKSTNMFSVLENSLIETYTNHSESKSIVDQRKKGYKETIDRIVKDIDFLTEQREKMFNKLTEGNANVDINQFDNESSFIQAYEKKNMYEELYLRTKVATLIKPFNKHTIATHSKLGGIIKMVVICLALAFAVAVFREIKV